MKMLTTAAVALCLLIFVGCDAADNQTPPTPDTMITAATNKVQANILGMDCTGCSSSVEAAVAKIDGVTGCSADVKSGDVVVALKDDADAEAKKAEIEQVIASLSDGKYKVKTITVATREAEAQPQDVQ